MVGSRRSSNAAVVMGIGAGGQRSRPVVGIL